MNDNDRVPGLNKLRLAKPVTVAAAVLTSLLGVEILFLSGQLAFFVAEGLIGAGMSTRGFPSEVVHNSFHFVEDTGYAFTAGALLLFLAWGPIRRGTRFGLVALVIGGLPSALLPIVAYELLGPWHDYVFHPAGLWILSVIGAGLGYVLTRREHTYRRFAVRSSTA